MTDIHATIDRLRRLYEKSTPGVWQKELDRNDQPNIYSSHSGDWVALLPHQCVTALEVLANANASFIVEAHNAMPALLEYIERLETMTGAHVIDSTDDSVKFDPKDFRIITKS